MVIPQNVIEDNPWWGAVEAIEHDPHLRRLRQQPFHHEHNLSVFELEKDAVYTLRGPRQVGKTTLVKILIRRLLMGEQHSIHSRQILYLNLYTTGITEPQSLQKILQEFIKGHRSTGSKKRLYLFLDEVTGITDWGIAVQALHERGYLENVFVFATGSNAMDVKEGGERMPGRRGDIENPDWILMPLSFRDYVRAIQRQKKENQTGLPEIDIFDVKTAYDQARKLEYLSIPLESLFECYLRTGGYPYAIAAEMENGYVPRRVYRQFQQAIREEMRKADRRETFFRELVAWAVEKYLGREFSWSTASGDTEIGSKNTARRYLEDGETVFIWHIIYRMKKMWQPTPAIRSPKKLYTVDPLCHHALSAWVEGTENPWEHTLEILGDNNFRGHFLESVVADHLARKYGRFVLYHRAPQGKEEIDFVVYRSRKDKTLLEVKNRTKIKKEDRRYLQKYEGGIIASKNQLEYWQKENITVVPIYTLLAGLPDGLTLYPSDE